LSVRAEAGQLRIGAPQIRLLSKDVLDRLRNGASVAYSFDIALSGSRGGAALDQITYRCVFSYDLWEEKFAVTRLEPSPRAVSHLTAAAAEAWCLDAMVISSGSLNPDRPFWVSLNYRTEALSPPDPSDDPGLTLGGLIDIFSRTNPRQPANGSRQAGPFRLSGLRGK
jgi:hypothetical protein